MGLGEILSWLRDFGILKSPEEQEEEKLPICERCGEVNTTGKSICEECEKEEIDENYAMEDMQKNAKEIAKDESSYWDEYNEDGGIADQD